jgi:Tol biopolymer transport system component
MALLQRGTRLGPYEVLSLIGAGGMGEVYRGHDTRLDRAVALKVLGPRLALDADSRARFTREARAVSALNHPHICSLYDIGREREIDYLVLELLDGETLEERLRRGALPLKDVIRFGIEIADALAAAHLHGIVHRDLKPGNILLTSRGTKLLDFGLAKVITPEGGGADVRTATGRDDTAAGTIIGTLHYMAPEQVTGGPADGRTDIFAFGAVLHEMITARRPFAATSQAGVFAKILEVDVPAVSTLAKGVPFALDYLIQRCLAKEPAERWHAAHDLKLQLQSIQALGSGSEAAPVSGPLVRRRWVRRAGAALAAAVLVAASILLPSRRPPAEQLTARLEITMPSHLRIDTIERAEISPDGRHIVLGAVVQGRQMLFIRDLASTQVTVLEDSEGAILPFWSPDSQTIGFFTSGRLKRVGIGGGPARDLADARVRNLQGAATWGRGVILFASSDGSILQVPDTGGITTAVATLPWASGKRAFESPRFLPDGRRFLVTEIGDPAPYLASLDAPGLRQLPLDGSHPVYAAGHLLYFRGTSAYARAFDPERVEFTGREVLLAGSADFLSTSHSGTVLYGAERTVPSRLTWFDRRGNPTAHVTDVGEYMQVVLSPSGKWATVVQPDARSVGRNLDLWNVELATRIAHRITTDPAPDSDPAWSPDERRLAFTSARSRTGGAYEKNMITGLEKPLVVRDEIFVVDQWTPDGKFVILRNAGRAVWWMAVSGEGTPEMLVDTPYQEDEVHVSPNGRWVAYNANLSGTWEVYVARFPQFTDQRQISGSGGVQPQWHAKGDELFYLGLDGALMAVPFNSTTGPEGRPPIRLFPTRFEPSPQQPQYAVSRDGAQFLGLERMAGDRASLVVLFNGLTTPSATSPQ